MKNISNNTAKKKALIFALVILAITIRANAQDYAFKVLATNGTVNLKAGNKRIWSGSILSPTDEVVVGSNSYVGLMHKGGKTLEIKQAGNYKISDLSSKVNAVNSSTSAKYASYVTTEMAKADRQDINKNHRKYMAITGSVQRAFKNTAYAYFAYPKDAQDAHSVTNLLNSNVTIRLYGNPSQEGIAKNKTFAIKVTDFYGKTIHTQDIKANEKGEAVVQLDFSKMQYKDAELILEVTVKEAKEPAKERSVYNINLVSNDPKFEEVKKDAAEYASEPTALNKVLEALIYEKANLFLDAATCYETAIAMEPNVDTYKIAYQDFLARNGMYLVVSGADLKPVTINENKLEETYKDAANTPTEEPKKEEKPKKEKSNKKVK